MFESLGGISDFVYVVNMSNYELLYFNDDSKVFFSEAEYSDKKCYEFIYGLTSPCVNCKEYCYKKRVTDDNELSQNAKEYTLKMDNNKIRIVIVNNSLTEDVENTLKYKELLLNCVLQLFDSKNIQDGIQNVLTLFGKEVNADRAFIIALDENLMNSSYEWCNKGITSNRQLLKDLPLNVIENWLPNLQRGESVVVPNVEELIDVNPAGYKLFKSGNTRRFIIAPLIKNNKLRGFVGLDNPPYHNLNVINPVTKVLSHIIMATMIQLEKEDELIQMSYHDSLSGLYNRNRYIKDLEILRDWHGSIGLLYADLNGLKEINDTEGHNGGNKAIVTISKGLSDVFFGYKIYRVGGDEFVVFCQDIKQDNFLKLLRRLEVFVDNSPYELSVGYKWIENCQDIGKLVVDADLQMYENKRKYYRNTTNESVLQRDYTNKINKQMNEYNILMSSLNVSVSKHLFQDDFKLIWANDYFYMLNGYTRDEFEEKFDNKVSEYFKDSPNVYQSLLEIIKTAFLAGKQNYETTISAKKKNGDSIWIHVVGTFTSEYIDDVPVIYTVITNVNESILAQKEQLVTYEGLPGFSAKVIVNGDNYKLVNGSQKFYDFFGYERGKANFELINKNLTFNQKSIERNLDKILHGETFTDEVCMLDYTSQWYNFQIYASCIDWDMKNPVYVLIFIDITENVEQRNKLLTLAYVDSITKGRSKTSFEEEVAKILKNSQSNDYCLVSLDIAKFNAINDTFGIEEGNRTLKYIYDIIVSCLNENECASRISSDIFNILMVNEDRQTIENRLLEIANKINSFNDSKSIKYYLSLKCGIYSIDNPEMQLIKIQDRANLARKKLKHYGDSKLSTCRFYNNVDTLELLREKDIENRMKSALENREFKIYLQPKFNLFTNRVDACEALIRWVSEEEIMPEEFIPLFERNGFIVELDYYVFEEVCKILKGWLDKGYQFDTVSFNMSRYHLIDNNKISRYEEIRTKYGIPPKYLEFEITESLIIESEDVIVEFIDGARKLGYHCSIDDFGSGYSSLNILKTIRADALKIDKEFFSDNGGERKDIIIDFVIMLAHRLGMKTVAEGVETAEQVEYLRSVECDMIQGYYYSKPITTQEFENLYF